METEGQWCDNAFCPDRGKIDTDNIKMHSYAERRFRCTTCQRTFSADKGTFFATLRTPRPILLDAIAMLVERNSLRAVSRIKHCGYPLKAGQLTYDCRYSTMHGMPVTGGHGFRGLKPLWYNGVPP